MGFPAGLRYPSISRLAAGPDSQEQAPRLYRKVRAGIMTDVRFIGGPLDSLLKAFEKPQPRLIVVSADWSKPQPEPQRHVYELEAGVYVYKGIDRA